MEKEKKFYIFKVDEKGRILLPDELVKSIHSGLLNVRIEDGKSLVEEPEPDCKFTWLSKDK